MHQHQCSLCATLWQHGEEWDHSIPAHECPTCGCHQFRLYKVRKAAEVRFDWPGLVSALADASNFVRSTALFTLEVTAADPRRVVPKVAEVATRDPEPMVRLAAVETLWRFGAAAAPAVPALALALQDAHAEVRRAAALTLSSLGAAAAGAMSALTGACQDREPRVRATAAAALAKIRADHERVTGSLFTFTTTTRFT